MNAHLEWIQNVSSLFENVVADINEEKMALSVSSRLKNICFSSSADNFVFKLCYLWTTSLLIASSFVVSCRLFVGGSFDCIFAELEKPPLRVDFVNLKCLADGTYTKPAMLILGKDASLLSGTSEQRVRKHQNYYQMVNMFLLVHAFNFFLPRLLWKSYEKSYVLRLASGVQDFFDKEEKRNLELCYLAKYILITQGTHKLYTSVYIMCETFNFLISIAHSVWLVHFFDVTGVPDSLHLDLVTWWDFQNFYFPSAGICEIDNLFGAKYLKSKAMYICEMPLNSLYMKIFLFLHAWYIVLTISTGLVLVYRILFSSPSFRVFVMKSFMCLVEKSILKSLCYRMSYSDWFFLTRLQKTMTDYDFAQMLDKITILAQVKNENKGKTNRLSFSDDRTWEHDISNATTLDL